jgi:hypothetical protein
MFLVNILFRFIYYWCTVLIIDCLLCMNAPKMRMLSCWSSSDGEEYVGNPDTYEEQQDQQQFVNQGKYSLGLPLFLFII